MNLNYVKLMKNTFNPQLFLKAAYSRKDKFNPEVFDRLLRELDNTITSECWVEIRCDLSLTL